MSEASRMAPRFLAWVTGKMGQPRMHMLGVVGESMQTLGSGDIKSKMPLEVQVQMAGGQVGKGIWNSGRSAGDPELSVHRLRVMWQRRWFRALTGLGVYSTARPPLHSLLT